VIADAYSIPVHVVTPKGSGSNGDSEACSRGMSFGMNQLALNQQQEARYTHTEWQTAVPFPKRDDMDAIHGYGTIALDFERKLAMSAQGSPTRPCGLESTPDFIIGDMDNGTTLSGICMAFAGTRTRVLGAAPMSGFWEYASKQYSSDKPPEGNYEHKYWEGIDVPMAAIPWATFRAPGNLSGVFEVDNEQMYAASLAARKHYHLYLDPDEVVPLAVALYNEDFRRLVAQAWGEFSKARGPSNHILLFSIFLSTRRSIRDDLMWPVDHTVNQSVAAVHFCLGFVPCAETTKCAGEVEIRCAMFVVAN
jgi:threonine dehydratase